MTPLKLQSRAPTKHPAILLSPVSSIQLQLSAPPSPRPPPSTQARHVAPTLNHPIRKKLEARGVEARHGKPTVVKKTAVDRFNDNREEESRRLNLKRKMEHEEKMASIRLKRHKYDLRYGSTGIPLTPGTSTPVLLTAAAAATSEDKQIEILRLQIRLAELTQDNSVHASSSRTLPSRPFQMPHASSSREEVSTPSSGLSYLSSGHNGFVDNSFMTSEDPGNYHVPDGEVSSGADATNWAETYNFAE